MAIPREIVDRVRSVVDVVEVVGQVVSLTKTGNHFAGLCPFHKERTPSFKVFPESQNFHCFGCGEGGSIFDFVMKTDGVSFPEAVRMLADRAGIEVPDRRRDPEGDREISEMSETLELAARFYETRLAGDPGKDARAYLAGRGIESGTIERFRIGYAPDAWDALGRALERHRDGAALARAGLAVKRKDGSGYYDRFRDRVVFPIVSPAGKVVGFGGRALGDAEPKYLNTPETRVYHKSHVLYGLREARAALRQARRVIVGEGYMDVVALAQAGIENAVATCGTSLTGEHAKILARYAPEVVLAFDADGAGVRAALKGYETLLPTGATVTSVAFPDGKDPADLVEAGELDELRRVLDDRQDLVDFFHAQSKGDPKPAAVDRLAELVALVPDVIPRRELSARAADWFKFDEETLVRVVESLRAGPRKAAPSAVLRRSESAIRGVHGLESELVRACVQDPDFWPEVRALAERGNVARVIDARVRRSVREFLDRLVEAGEAKPVSAYRDEVQDPALRTFLMELAAEGAVDREHLERTERDLVSRLFYLALKDERDRLQRALSQAERSGDGERAGEISGKYGETLQRLRAIEEKRSTDGAAMPDTGA